MSLLRRGRAWALTIYLGESDQWHGQPLSTAIIQLLRSRGCAGATATRAVAGYGAGARLHEQGSWRWSSDASLVIEVIDQPERLRRLLPELQEMLSGGLITTHEVDVVKYTHARTHGLPTKLPVAQVMETAITTVSPETPVAAVLSLLLAAPFRALPVVDQQRKLEGIISTGDLIEAGLLPVRRGVVRTAQELDPQTAEAIEAPLAQASRSELSAQDVMNRQVRSVGPETSIRDAAQVMVETGLKRLPVVGADGTLQGMLSRSDLLQVIVTSPIMAAQASTSAHSAGQSRPLTGDLAQRQPVSAYMNSEVTTVGEQTPLAEVIDALLLAPLKRVIVVDDEQRVRGIISDVDVLRQVQQEGRSGLLSLLTGWARGSPGRVPTGILRPASGKARSAADLMNREVVTVLETDSVQQSIERMMTTRRKVLPVVDAENHLKGVIGRSDLLRLLIEE